MNIMLMYRRKAKGGSVLAMRAVALALSDQRVAAGFYHAAHALKHRAMLLTSPSLHHLDLADIVGVKR
ncbi:hypothetical protein [Litchfieldella xinjiangensis]|uniref:hypothetical protein n=1 Tax=Litchfieldella xinjiangensis TaxID=1166948 RepID=UPI0005BB5849|nr:hypothetical protein [Halomonas xinjiangensis]